MLCLEWRVHKGLGHDINAEKGTESQTCGPSTYSYVNTGTTSNPSVK